MFSDSDLKLYSSFLYSIYVVSNFNASFIADCDIKFNVGKIIFLVSNFFIDLINTLDCLYSLIVFKLNEPPTVVVILAFFAFLEISIIIFCKYLPSGVIEGLKKLLDKSERPIVILLTKPSDWDIISSIFSYQFWFLY